MSSGARFGQTAAERKHKKHKKDAMKQPDRGEEKYKMKGSAQKKVAKELMESLGLGEFQGAEARHHSLWPPNSHSSG